MAELPKADSLLTEDNLREGKVLDLPAIGELLADGVIIRGELTELTRIGDILNEGVLVNGVMVYPTVIYISTDRTKDDWPAVNGHSSALLKVKAKHILKLKEK